MEIRLVRSQEWNGDETEMESEKHYIKGISELKSKTSEKYKRYQEFRC